MTAITIVPGSELVFDGGGTSSPYNLPSPAIVGSDPVVSDGSDASYWDLGMVTYSGAGGNRARNLYAQIPATTLTADDLKIRIRCDQTLLGSAYTDPQIGFGIYDLDGADTDQGNFGNNFHWEPDRIHVTVNSDFTDYTIDLSTGAGGFFSMDQLLEFIASGDAWLSVYTFGVRSAGLFTGSVESRVSELSITSADPITLPCDTVVDLDLSTAIFSNPSGTSPDGQYVDGVITGLDGSYPQFWFPFELDALKSYDVEIEFDPTSPHDGDGDSGTSDRWITLYDTTPYDEDFGTGVSILDATANTLDIASLTIGPGIDNWDDPDSGVAQGFTRLLFQASGSGAVSAIRITKVCTDESSSSSGGGSESSSSDGGGPGDSETPPSYLIGEPVIIEARQVAVVVEVDGATRPMSVSGPADYDAIESFPAVAGQTECYVFTLAHTPIAGSVTVTWGSLPLPPTSWSLADADLTICDPDALAADGDDFRVHYRWGGV